MFVFHFLYVLVSAFGWLLPGNFFYLFLITWLIAFLVDVIWAVCPLTVVEWGLRRKLNPGQVFDKSCIAHYTRKWRGLPPRPPITGKKTFWQRYSFIAIMLGLLVLGFVWQWLAYEKNFLTLWF